MNDDEEEQKYRELRAQLVQAVEGVLGPLSNFVVVFDCRTIDADFTGDFIDHAQPDHMPGYAQNGLLLDTLRANGYT